MNTQNKESNASKSPKKKRGCLRFLLFFILFIFLGFSILLYIRYNAWFGNLPEEPYIVTSELDRITLTPGEDFMRERTISWRCDTTLHNAHVEYFKLDSTTNDTTFISISAIGKKVKSRAGEAFYYHAKLSDLEIGSAYGYRVISNDTSEWKSFVMPNSQDSLRFMFIGDIQDPIGRESNKLFNSIRDKAKQYDFIAFGGDQIERPMDKYWIIWYNSIGLWASQLPLIMAAGNHEYIKGLNKELDARWTAQHNYPPNGPYDFRGKSYFIDTPLMRMIVIDSNVIQWPIAVYQHMKWLKKTLKESTQPWKVVMFHHGVYSVREGRSNLLMNYLFLPILLKNGADLVLQGHDHAYSRITRKQDGDTIPPIFVISSASPKNYRNGFDAIHDRLGSNLSLYQDIKITKDELSYQSLFFNGEPYDDLIIQRKEDGSKQIIDNARHWEEQFLFDSFDKSEKGREKRKKYRDKAKERILRRFNK